MSAARAKAVTDWLADHRDEMVELLEAAHCLTDSSLNMTHLALRLSRFVNGVAMKHREVSQEMFPNFPVDAITNGVHAGTWTSAPFAALYDRHLPDWRRDNWQLRQAIGIPLPELAVAVADGANATMLLTGVRHFRH